MKYKIQNTYDESTLKTLEKSGKIYLIYTTLESGERTKIACFAVVSSTAQVTSSLTRASGCVVPA